MNKYNIRDEVYYLGTECIRTGTVEVISRDSKGKIYYGMLPNYGTGNLPEYAVHKTVDELIEWLKTTVK